MSEMLSQAEIDALLNGSSIMDTDSDNETYAEPSLSPQEIDALGEIGNISMGTSATTLFTLLGHKVVITTPRVTVTTWDEMSKEYTIPYVAVKVEYTDGIFGSNLLIMKEYDVKVITDLMMGGEGKNTDGELTDLHLSAISEAMNQMVGSSATSMSSMFSKRIEISPPESFMIMFDTAQPYEAFKSTEKIVKVAFKMVVENYIDSEIMQLIPIDFAKKMVENLLAANLGNNVQTAPVEPVSPLMAQPQLHNSDLVMESGYGYNQENNDAYQTNFNKRDREDEYMSMRRGNRHVNVQPAHFQALDDETLTFEKKNINLIMDVPLQVTVELGRTHKLIRDILEFGSGSIIELDKLAGDPVDILVNGKAIAKGEVVVIDESFGVRITDIIHPSKRL